MLDKLSPNQRLILAVVLSFIFFVAYTTIFPPEVQENLEANSTKQATVAVNQTPSTSPAVEATVGHEISTNESMGSAVSNTLVTITSDAYILKIDTLGRISSKVMQADKYNNKEDSHAELISQNGAKPLFIRFADKQINDAAMATSYTASASNIALKKGEPQEVTLTQTLPNLSVEKKLTFYEDGHYDIKVKLSDAKRYYLYLGKRPEINSKMMTVVGSMVYAGDNRTTIFEDGDVDARATFNDVHLASAFDQYYATIFYDFSPDINVVVERDRDDNPVVYLDATPTMNLQGYIGPKNYEILESIKPVLVNAIEYGWFTFASRPLFALLSWLHGFFGNWGWAIIALTLIIRLMLYPLTYRGMMSMQKIKDLAPKIKDIRDKHKGDPQRMNAATMEMYKKHGANPLGGCLPLVLQIPVFFAIYRVLLNAVELEGAPWMLWVNDLSRMDPYYILPVLMGVSMFYQQKMTPTNFTDPMQAKIFKYLPVVFTIFFVTFPSGLVLYWFVNNLFSIGQQFIVNRNYALNKAKLHEAHLAEKQNDKD